MDISAVTTVVVTVVAGIAEAVKIVVATEVATIVALLVENIVEAKIANPAVIPENPVDGVQKARAAPASAEISRGAFI